VPLVISDTQSDLSKQTSVRPAGPAKGERGSFLTFAPKIAGFATLFTIIKAVLAETHLVIRLANLAQAFAFALLLILAARTTKKHTQ
jgi:hypothetical protein